MPSSLPPDERRRRRAALRQHHPDLGGDAAEFIRTLRAWESRAATGPAGSEVRFVRRPRGVRRLLAWWQRSRSRRSRAARRVV